MEYKFKDIVAAIARRFYIESSKSLLTLKQWLELEGVNFENVMCEYVDAINIIKSIKNINKRAIIMYRAMGYCNWEIAIFLGISERTVDRLIRSIKIFCRKVGR